jgi:hypothetical protein
MIETELAQIDGIGPTLRDRIIQYSFDGTLPSLRGAYRVRGVGQQKQWAIQRWVQKREQELPRRMKEEFPSKNRINDQYDQRERKLEKSLKKIEEEIDAMHRLATTASTEEERLSQVTVAQFRQAYKQDKEASEAVAEYLQGSFAEWESMPVWFETLISKYGG